MKIYLVKEVWSTYYERTPEHNPAESVRVIVVMSDYYATLEKAIDYAKQKAHWTYNKVGDHARYDKPSIKTFPKMDGTEQLYFIVHVKPEECKTLGENILYQDREWTIDTIEVTE